MERPSDTTSVTPTGSRPSAELFRRASGHLELLKSRNSKISGQIVERSEMLKKGSKSFSDRLRSSCKALIEADSAMDRYEMPSWMVNEGLEAKNHAVRVCTTNTMTESAPMDDVIYEFPSDQVACQSPSSPENESTNLSHQQILVQFTSKPEISLVEEPKSLNLGLLNHHTETETIRDTYRPPPKSILKKYDSSLKIISPNRGRRIRFDQSITFWSACHEGNMNEIMEILPKLTDVHCANPSGMTSLAAACVAGHREVVKYLLVNGCDPNIKDKLGWTPLHYAACIGDVEICKILVTNKASLFCRNNEKQTPLEVCKDMYLSYPKHQNWKQVHQYLADEQSILSKAASSNSSTLRTVGAFQSQDPQYLRLEPNDCIEVTQFGSELDNACVGKIWRRGEESSEGLVPLHMLTMYPKTSQV